MKVIENHVNASKQYHIGNTQYEPFTDNIGKLFRSYQKEYGKCISYVYIDNRTGGKSRPVGWVFVKKMKYDDCDKYYLHETWITLVIDNSEYKYLD